MASVANPSIVKQLVREHNIRAKKRWGQHFLISPPVVERVLQLADITAEDRVLEIGPGLGALTERLLQLAERVVAVEIDARLAALLRQRLGDDPRLQVIEADVLAVDLAEIITGGRWKVVGNLPYYITSPILKKFLESALPLQSLTLMMQKEVAQRLAASPGGKDYGLLTVAVQYYARVLPGGVVSPGCFWPQPEVESALLKLLPGQQEAVEVCSREAFFEVARALFGQRRKIMGNALQSLKGVALERRELDRRIRRTGIDPGRRGETLSLPEIALLTNSIYLE